MASSVEILNLKARHYPVGESLSRPVLIGRAVDACLKELVAEIGATPSARFDPHDYFICGLYHEIKSSAGTWISVPNSEVEFGDAEIADGRDVIYDIVRQLDLNSAMFLGSVHLSSFRHLLEPSDYSTQRKLPDGSWVEERSHRILLSKLIPLLT